MVMQLQPVTIGKISKILLDYVAATDIANGVAVTGNTWTDLSANQSFTVEDANSIIVIAVRGNAILGGHATATSAACRLVIDSAGTPVNIVIGGERLVANDYANVLSGVGSVGVTGLAAGSHTVKVQVYSLTLNETLYCRANTYAPVENFALQVTEIKR